MLAIHMDIIHTLTLDMSPLDPAVDWIQSPRVRIARCGVYSMYFYPFCSSGLDPVTQGHVVKREADADAYYLGYPYAFGAAYPYAYGYVPFGSSTGLDPITQGKD